MTIRQERRQPIIVLLAMSNMIICEGLRRIVTENTQNNAYCLHSCNNFPPPHIILFDFHQEMQNLQLAYPAAKPILLDTGLSEQETACLLLCHKVRGIISQTASVEMLHKAIRVVNGGDIWIDQKHLKTLLQKNETITTNGDLKALSSQDKRIIQLITQGQKNREIAKTLCLSEHTIKAHVSRIYKRLKVSNRSQLVSVAKENKLELHPLP